MTTVDWAIFAVYLVGITALGLSFSRRQSRPNEFFLAGRTMGWLPIGLSVMVTAFTAINYTAFSGEVFQHGLYVTLSLPVFVIVAWPITRVIMPFYHSMGLTSAYEYMERRFDVRVRCAASGLFIAWILAWMAVALYVPCHVLHMMTGLSTAQLLLIAGGLTTLYTMSGGMRSVMLTDVAQFCVLIGGLVVALVAACMSEPGGLASILRQGVDDGLGRPFYPFDPKMFSLDPTSRITLWTALIGTFVAFMARYGADQVIVQRYFTARSLRDARRGFHLNYVSAITALLLLALMGFAIHAHAARTGTLGREKDPIFYFARFVMDLPAGVNGLIVAGLFAATMSSINAGMNSCSAAFKIDFYDRLVRPVAENDDPLRTVRIGRLLTFIFGIGAVLLAFHVGRLGSIFEIANKIINGLGAPLLAILLMGMFSRRANGPGMLAGAAVGTLWSIASPFLITNLALHYYAVLNLGVTWVACWVGSLVAHLNGHRATQEQLSWTWFARRAQAKLKKGES